jgi:hypothetical protein
MFDVNDRANSSRWSLWNKSRTRRYVYVVSEKILFSWLLNFITSFMKFFISLFDTHELCSSSQSFYFIRYWIIVVRSYFRTRFFSNFSTSKDFFVKISFVVSIESELINRDRSYESKSSSTNFNCVIDITKCIRVVAEIFSSYVKLFTLRRMMYDSDRWFDNFEFFFFEREYSRWSRRYTLSSVLKAKDLCLTS